MTRSSCRPGLIRLQTVTRVVVKEDLRPCMKHGRHEFQVQRSEVSCRKGRRHADLEPGKGPGVGMPVRPQLCVLTMPAASVSPCLRRSHPPLLNAQDILWSVLYIDNMNNKAKDLRPMHGGYGTPGGTGDSFKDVVGAEFIGILCVLMFSTLRCWAQPSHAKPGFASQLSATLIQD